MCPNRYCGLHNNNRIPIHLEPYRTFIFALLHFDRGDKQDFIDVV